MEEFGAGRAALDLLIDLVIEEIVVKESLDELLDQLESEFGGCRPQVDLLDEQWETRVQAWVDVDGLADDFLQLLEAPLVAEQVCAQVLRSLSALILVLSAEIDVS